jgi:hypothetical protein
MAYQYLQALPQIAAGASNKLWIVPAELTKALEGIGGALGGLAPMSDERRSQLVRAHEEEGQVGESPDAIEAREQAEAAAAEAASAAAAASAEVSGGPALNGGGAHRSLPSAVDEVDDTVPEATR